MDTGSLLLIRGSWSLINKNRKTNYYETNAACSQFHFRLNCISFSNISFHAEFPAVGRAKKQVLCKNQCRTGNKGVSLSRLEVVKCPEGPHIPLGKLLLKNEI